MIKDICKSIQQYYDLHEDASYFKTDGRELGTNWLIDVLMILIFGTRCAFRKLFVIDVCD